MSLTEHHSTEHRSAERTGEDDDGHASAHVVGFLAACASFVALWPYTSVIEAGFWSFVSGTVIIVVVIAGAVARRVRRGSGLRWRGTRWLWALVVQVIVAICTLTVLILPQGALLGIIPTSTTVGAVGSLAAEGFAQVQTGVAPLNDTVALRLVLGIGFAVLTIVLDHLIARRFTLIAVLVVAFAGALPMIATLGEANVPWFVILAILTLFLLRHSIRHDRRAPRQASTGVIIGVGAAAIVVTLVIAPVLPVSATWITGGTSLTLNPSLRLGDDLRRPAPSDVITLATIEKTAPYLRIATLSRFDGRIWSPDKADTEPLADGFGEADWSDSITTVERRTSIRINGISSSWLPVPYPATKIVGASSSWEVMPLNRTVQSETEDAAGEDYTVTATAVKPTLEQIRASSAVRNSTDAPTEEDVPEVIAATAVEVTADAETDYDRLIAMQSWFRSQFTYSLDAPVEGDFDGTGGDAVAAFLDARAGYCIHFAGAFALMAQALDMPVRIVVGYLPGRLTDDKRGDEFIYVVSSDQLHAWPEVRFEGIGWVPFEPTASLGEPTGFQPAVTPGGTSTDPNTPEPTAAPTTAPTSGPELDRDQSDSATAGGESLQRLDPTPVLLVVLGALLIVLLPALARLAVRTHRRGRARRGDAMAAWRELHDTLVDLRLPVSDADTPRMRGAGLIEQGADAATVHALVSAIERSSYSRSDEEAGDLSHDLARVSADLRQSVDPGVRLAAVVLPRSLFAAAASRESVTS